MTDIPDLPHIHDWVLFANPQVAECITCGEFRRWPERWRRATPLEWKLARVRDRCVPITDPGPTIHELRSIMEKKT